MFPPSPSAAYLLPLPCGLTFPGDQAGERAEVRNRSGHGCYLLGVWETRAHNATIGQNHSELGGRIDTWFSFLHTVLRLHCNVNQRRQNLSRAPWLKKCPKILNFGSEKKGTAKADDCNSTSARLVQLSPGFAVFTYTTISEQKCRAIKDTRDVRNGEINEPTATTMASFCTFSPIKVRKEGKQFCGHTCFYMWRVTSWQLLRSNPHTDHWALLHPWTSKHPLKDCYVLILPFSSVRAQH